MLCRRVAKKIRMETGGLADALVRPHQSSVRTKSIFRGVIAPASLKQGRAATEAVRPVAYFPGCYRPGLIEATRTNARKPRSAGNFPGCYRPGLIEAGFNIIKPQFIGVFSGVLSPRPH
jgi:hypothetical protein